MERIVTMCLLVFCIPLCCVVLAQDKRVLLHNDQDLYQVISSMQAEMAALNSSLKAATTEIVALKSSLQTERTSMAALNSTLQSKIKTLETNLISAQQTTGSVYVRWGRTSCPSNGTEMIYKGRMAGSKYSESGGAANHLCLPDDPSWGKYVDGTTVYGSIIHGTEMGLPDSVSNVLFGKPVHNQDVPCAVCSTTRSMNVMIGGRATCYPGWTMEYQGYVAATGRSYPNNVDYVCVDIGLEFSPHGASNDDDHIIEVCEVACGNSGSLPCPPYANGRELSCVVCSK